MKEERFTKILGEIDEEFIAEVHSEEKTAKIVPLKKWLALAACACLLAVSGIAVVAEMTNVTYKVEQNVIMEVHHRDRKVSSVNITTNLERINKNEINMEVIKNFKNGTGTLYFDTAEEAREYIGYDKLIIPDMGLKGGTMYPADNPELPFSASVMTFGKGKKLDQVITHIYYETEPYEDIILCTSRTCIGNSKKEYKNETQYNFLDVFSDIKSEERTTENGTEYLVVYIPRWPSGANIKAVLVKDGTEYTFDSHYFFVSQKAEHEEYLLRWANSF